MVVLIILTDGATITNHMRHCRSRSGGSRFLCFVLEKKGEFLVSTYPKSEMRDF